MKTRQKILKINNSYSSIPNSKKNEVIASIRKYIGNTLDNLSSNFSQTTVREELDKLKENYIPKDHSNDYIIEPGQIEYKSNYSNIFNDKIKYGILADIRDSTNERLDKIEDTVEKIYKKIEYIKNKLKINDKSLYEIRQKLLYEKMISYNNSLNNTLQTLSDINTTNNNNDDTYYDNNSSLKLNPHIYIKDNINNESKMSIGTSCCSEKRKIKNNNNNEKDKKSFYNESDNENNNHHGKNLNSESSILSTDRKSKGSFIINVNIKK